MAERLKGSWQIGKITGIHTFNLIPGFPMDGGRILRATTISELVDNYFLRYGYGGFPVLEGERLVGIISLKEIKGLPKNKWINTSAKKVIRTLNNSLVVSEVKC